MTGHGLTRGRFAAALLLGVLPGAEVLAAPQGTDAAAATQATSLPASRTPDTAGNTAAATQKAEPEYIVANTFNVGGEGVWDPWSAEPVTLDDQGKLLYVSRYHRTQVIEVASGKVVAEIPGVEPRMTALVPAAGRGFISEVTQATVTVFDLKSYAVLGKVAVGDNPHGIIYDPASKRVLVGCEGKLVPIAADIDLKTGKADPAIEFEGSPGGLVADGRGMVYMTIVDQNQVAVIDTREMRLATTWQIADWYGPRGICLDRERSRLYLGCRARVVVLSAVEGRELADVIVGGPDMWAGMGCVEFFDGKAFATCGEGVLSMIGQTGEGKFVVERKVTIPKQAWGMAVDGKTETIYLPAADASASEGKRKVRGIKLVTVAKK